MTTNDDLEDFFKKKDRKGNKHKKPTGLLTNNEELLKQLVIVTSATTAFKENMDFDEDDDEENVISNQNRRQLVEESNGIMGVCDDNSTAMNKYRAQGTSVNKSKNSTKLTVQDNHNHMKEPDSTNGQQDEWEEFENSNPKYDQLRLKFLRDTNDQVVSDEDEDQDYYDDDHHGGNPNDGTANTNGENGEPSTRNNRRRGEQQQKDKPVWNINQVKQSEPIPPTESAADKVADLPAKPATGNEAYRPPQLRGNSSITIVSGVSQRVSKKEKPNLASTEEFPTLGAAVNKK